MCFFFFNKKIIKSIHKESNLKFTSVLYVKIALESGFVALYYCYLSTLQTTHSNQTHI